MTKTKKKEEENVAVSTKDTVYIPSTEIKTIGPIRRLRKGVPINHETNFKFRDAYDKYMLPLVTSNGKTKYKNPFKSDLERKWLEKELGEDLNIYKKEDNYFDTFVVKLTKTKETFKMNDPNDLLAVRILEQNSDFVCTEPDQRLNKITYKWILSKEDFQNIEKTKAGEREIELWAYYNKAQNDKKELISFLRLRGQFPPSNVTLSWLQSQVYDEIKANPVDCYIQIMDEDREYKILMDRALESRAIIFQGEEGYFIKGRSHSFAANKANVLIYFKDPRNAEDVAEIKAHIKEFEDRYK